MRDLLPGITTFWNLERSLFDISRVVKI